MSKYLLEMKQITKEFPGVKALDGVSLAVRDRSIHAIVGENGAGKSTLMNVLSGVYPYGSYEGEILMHGDLCKFRSIKDSEAEHIVIIHQELALIPELSVKENIFLGNEQAKKGVIDWFETTRKAQALLQKIGLNVDPDIPIKELGVGQQQMVEIAKALSKDVHLLIMDEPTAALNDDDSAKLLELIKELNQEQGLSVIIISHKLNEVLSVADDVTIIRDGTVVETLENNSELSEDRIVRGMVGRTIVDYFPKRDAEIGDLCLEVKDWTVYSPTVQNRKIVDNVSFNVRRGEVVGIAGLMGAGRTELAMSIFGKAFGSKITGEIFKDGKKLNLQNVGDALRSGIAYATEDRKESGLILTDDLKVNITLPSLDKISNRGVLDKNLEIVIAEEYREKMKIKSPDVFQKAGNLSGGNQQKVMLARFLYNQPDVLILDEPTRGIDVGAKHEIYLLINALACSGKAVIIISSELPEVLGMSDRIYIMNEGRFIGEMTKEEASQEAIMALIVSSDKAEAV